jgi:drug/metabolite transporter (DMT)-like permease
VTVSPEIFAGAAAVCFAASNICVRRGVVDTTVVAGLIVSLAVGTMLTLVVVWIDAPSDLSARGVVDFAVAGVLGAALGRGGAMVGVNLLGPSVSVPLYGSLYPVFAVATAVLTLGERVGPGQISGLSVVVLGVWLLSRRQAEVFAEDPGASPSRRWRPWAATPAILFPLMAGLFFGASDVFRKRAIEVFPDAVFGAMIGTASALVFWSVAALSFGAVRNRVRFGKGMGWFALNGVLSTTAVLSLISALQDGDVSVVSPIVAAEPLPVVLMSALFLRRLERIDTRIVVGAVCVVVGTALVSLSVA